MLKLHFLAVASLIRIAFFFFQLYLTALDKRQKSWGSVEFHRFGAEGGYGHAFICRAPELPGIINTFFETFGNKRY